MAVVEVARMLPSPAQAIMVRTTTMQPQIRTMQTNLLLLTAVLRMMAWIEHRCEP